MDYATSKHERTRENKVRAKNSKYKTVVMRQKRMIDPDKIFQDSNVKYWKSTKFFSKDPNNEIAIIREFCFKDDPTIFCTPAVKYNKPAKKVNLSFVLEM